MPRACATAVEAARASCKRSRVITLTTLHSIRRVIIKIVIILIVIVIIVVIIIVIIIIVSLSEPWLLQCLLMRLHFL